MTTNNKITYLPIRGDISGTTGGAIVVKLQSNPILAQTLGSIQDGYVLTWNAGGGYYYAAPSSGGGGGSLSGDVSGILSANTVIKINGATVPTAGATSTVLQVSGTNTLSYTLLSDTNISSSAAISGTKISPNFGTQNIISTGGITIGSIRDTGISVAGVVLTDSSGNFTSGTVNLASATYINGILPAVNQAPQTMGGDISGTTIGATVIKLQGNAVLAQSLTITQDGYALTWNNATSKWQASPIVSALPAGGAGGDLSGTYPNPTVAKLNGITLSGTPSSGQVITATGFTTANWQTPASGAFVAGGDLSGTSSSQTVIKINGNPVSAQSLLIGQDGYVLTWSFADGYYKAAPSSGGGGGGGGAPTGPAGGNLSGNYPNPLVSTTTPVFFSNLSSALPNGSRSIITLDGYRAQGDGGEGSFEWVIGSYTSDGGTIVVPTGMTGVGAWIRNTSQSPGIYNVLWFGAHADGYTDDWTTIQHVINLNTSTTNAKDVLLPESLINSLATGGVLGQRTTCYAISQPLNLDNTTSNLTKVIRGTDRRRVWLVPTTRSGVPSPYAHDLAWYGPGIIAGYMGAPITTAIDGYNGTNMTVGVGGQVGQVASWFLNLSQYQWGDINGATNFCIEFFWNELSSTPATFAATYMAACQGCAKRVVTSAFSIYRYNPSGTGISIQATMTTTAGSFIVKSAVGHDLVANSMNHIALTYDGYNIRLFINGGQPDSTMTAAATGTISQSWFEEIVIGSAGFYQYPGGGQANGTAANYRLGVTRLSIGTARYTAPFTPSVANVKTVDGFTNYMVDFANTPTNGTLGGTSQILGFVIGKNGTTVGAGSTGNSAYLDLNFQSLSGSEGLSITDLTLYMPGGIGILLWGSVGVSIGRITLYACTQGINVEAYSYNVNIFGDVNFFLCGPSGNYHSWNMFFGNGSQFSKIGPNVNSGFSPVNWHIVHCFADLTCEMSWINDVSQGMLYVSNLAGCVNLGSISFTDEQSTGLKNAIVCIDSGKCSLVWSGGFTVIQVNNAPQFYLGGHGPITVTAQLIGPVGFSFGAPDSGTVPIPAICANVSQLTNVIDPANPGPVLVTSQESFGINIITFTSDANKTIGNNDILWKMLQINDGYGLTATRNIIVPLAIPGYIRTVFNNTAQNIIFGYSAGSTVTIGAGKTAEIRSSRNKATNNIANILNSSGLIEITCTAHGFSTGNLITVSGVMGTVEANGTWIITVIDANNFTLNGSSFVNTFIPIFFVSTPVVYSNYWQRITADI